MSATAPESPSRRAFFLRPGAVKAPAVALGEHCFALRGIHCESCRDSCEPNALRFVPRLGAPSLPVFDVTLCNRCGECAKLCPANAITVAPEDNHG